MELGVATGRYGRKGRAIGLAGATVLALGGAAHAQPAPAAPGPAAAAATPLRGPWSDPSRSPDERARAALAAMTVDEEVSILSTPLPIQLGPKAPPGVPKSAGFIPAVPRLGLAAISETDASLGVANGGEQRPGDVATALPASIALGASFDPQLAYAGAAMIGGEARAKGFGIMLAGGADLIRDPRGGRNFEYISEDPLLTGVLAGRAIAGVQDNHVVSTLKHFALNDLETGRLVYSVDMAEAPMRESDLLAFEIAHEVGRPGAVMCAYNRVNSVYACENPFLLTDVLRRDWGFDGFVMSDWGAVHSTGAALAAGLDQQSGHQGDRRHYFGEDLKAALEAGEVTKAAVDQAALRILRTLFAHGVYDAPPVAGGVIDYAANARVAQAQAEAGMVLLRNEGGLLPLAGSAKRIAVIGGHADVGVLSGGGSSQVIPVGGAKLVVSRPDGEPNNFIKRTYGGTSPLAALKAQFPQAQVDFVDGTDPAKAATLARSADVAVVFAEKWATEGSDLPDLGLGAGQDELIAAVAQANPKTVVVLETGNAVLTPWRDQVGAILEAWYPGQRGGEAIARVLAGAADPGGRLPVTFPASVDQLPHPQLPGADVAAPPKSSDPHDGIIDKVPFAYGFPEGADAGYRWFEKTGAQPLYPFGFGLSYTRFRYTGLQADGGKALHVVFTVANAGGRTGVDTPQVYVTPPGKTRRLIGWGRTTLAPGASTAVVVAADPRVLADFDARTRSWVVRPGVYRVEVAASSGAPPALQADVELVGQRLPEAPRPR